MRLGTLRHEIISAYLLLETWGIFLLLGGAQVLLAGSADPRRLLLQAPLWLLQGLWLDRMYTAAHEGVHRKLLPAQPRLNDLLSSMLLWPLCAPLTLFRRIHAFHHGQNRRDARTAALDTFPLRRPPTPLRRRYYEAVWIFCVFLGGFFVHTLASFLIFLLVPTRRAVRISPVFAAFPRRLRALAFAELCAGVALHLLCWRLLGPRAYAAVMLYPLLAFAWVWSMLLYIYHYRTSYGAPVKDNVRSLPRHWFFSWLLLNFNEHATHHGDASIPWYELPLRRREAAPRAEAPRAEVGTLFEAIWQQRHGPVLAVLDPEDRG